MPAGCGSPTSAGIDATHYPLSLAAAPGERLQLRLELSARPVRAGERGGDWRRGWSGCWRRRLPMPRPADRQARHSQPRGAPHHPARLERHRARGPVRHAAGAVRGAGRDDARCDRGGVRGSAASPTASSMRARTSWRIICARSGSAPRWWWGCASSARWRCWSGCSASSRPAAPICRSTRTIRPSGSPSCWHDAARAGAGHAVGAARRGCPRTTPGIVLPRCRLARDRSAARDRAGQRPRTRKTPPMSSTPRAPPEPRRASVVTHAGIPQSGAAQVERFAMTPAARVLQFASLELRCRDLRTLVHRR